MDLEEDSLAQHTTVNVEASTDVSGGINNTSVDVCGNISDTSGADVNQADSGDPDLGMTDDIVDENLHFTEIFDMVTEPRSNSRYSLRARVKRPVSSSG